MLSPHWKSRIGDALSSLEAASGMLSPHWNGSSFLFVDNGPHVFPGQGLGNVAGDQAIYYLDVFNDLAVLDYFQTRPLNHQVILFFVHQVSRADFGDEFRVGIFLGVVCEQPTFVFDKYYSL
jgi:hypothetical protein